jgi:hypothetical protein
VPAAQQRAQGQATVEALLDKSQPLPDPRALARLYQDQVLTRLPDETDEVAAAPAAPAAAPAWSELPVPPPAPGSIAHSQPPPPTEAASSRPTMTPAEMRQVMNNLQEKFSSSSYRIFEPPKRVVEDDYAAASMREREERERAELEELAREARHSNVVSLLGAVLVIVVIGGFIWLATSGPLKAKPAPSATPTATAKP